MDLDGDGVISMYEMEYFYDEQMQKMESLGIEKLPFEDCLCQVNICYRRCTVNWVPEITVLMSFKCDTCIQIDLWYFLGLGVVKLLFLIFTCFLKTFFSALRFLWHSYDIGIVMIISDAWSSQTESFG